MKATVIGDGGWGTALAMVLDRNGHDVVVWGPFPEYIEEVKTTGENKTYLPGVGIPASLSDNPTICACSRRIKGPSSINCFSRETLLIGS